jgi:transcriptional repressor NrdR
MECVYCSFDTRVTNSRWQKRSNQIWRRRQCERCRAVFTTHEAVDLSKSFSVHYKGSVKPFLPDLLYTEVLLALQHRPNNYLEAREITNTIIQRLLKSPDEALFETTQISETSAGVLKRFDKRAWMRYVADHPSLQG